MPRANLKRLDPADILNAYALGYFPMARTRSDADVVWVLPERRGVLQLARARAPKKLRRLVKRETFRVRVDTAFSAVVAACAEAAPGREDTWINADIEKAYAALHAQGVAHSVECWRNGALVGGRYGVAVGGVFCGESMFSREADASKVAMLHLIARLRIGGFEVLDTQFHTEHLAQFGVEERPNAAYQEMLKRLVAVGADFNRAPGQLSSTTVLQSITQTS
ncbi:MAG: leucyl/phenylalanyl-tRNA--protein transferase [Parvularculaceae bacterium]